MHQIHALAWCCVQFVAIFTWNKIKSLHSKNILYFYVAYYQLVYIVLKHPISTHFTQTAVVITHQQITVHVTSFQNMRSFLLRSTNHNSPVAPCCPLLAVCPIVSFHAAPARTVFTVAPIIIRYLVHQFLLDYLSSAVCWGTKKYTEISFGCLAVVYEPNQEGQDRSGFI